MRRVFLAMVLSITVFAIEPDKAAHFSTSALLTVLTYKVTKSHTASIVIPFLLGLTKEFLDPTFSVGDMSANMFGIAFGVALNLP